MVSLLVCPPENEKVIDYKVFSKFCKICSDWKGDKNTDKYLIWKAQHEPECAINHIESSGAMQWRPKEPSTFLTLL